jgi:hypothetical protein
VNFCIFIELKANATCMCGVTSSAKTWPDSGIRVVV